jgi:hypothetical protein
MRTILSTAFFALLMSFVAAFSCGSAYAQATRTWVSGTGDDANPCSRTAPCKTFAGAISKTAAAGEINVIDTGGFGAVTITKAITIRSDHVEAGVLVAGTNGITVAAGATDSVVLEGLDFDGAAGVGLNGVSFTSGAQVYIIKCSIRHFSQNGVNIASSTANARAFISDTIINLNGGNGTTGGLNIQGNSNIVSVLNTIIDNNGAYSVQAGGGSGTGTNQVALAHSVLNASPVALSLLAGGKAYSIGPSNVISGTGTLTGTFPFN